MRQTLCVPELMQGDLVKLASMFALESRNVDMIQHFRVQVRVPHTPIGDVPFVVLISLLVKPMIIVSAFAE